MVELGRMLYHARYIQPHLPKRIPVGFFCSPLAMSADSPAHTLSVLVFRHLCIAHTDMRAGDSKHDYSYGSNGYREILIQSSLQMRSLDSQ